MKVRIVLSFVWISISLYGNALPVDRTDELPIRIHRIMDRLTIFKAGDNPTGPNVTVVESSEGLIVIDTHMSPAITSRIRRAIETEFGRDDFIYIINTHHHFDHIGGNQVFTDAKIIGHERCVQAMRTFESGIGEFIERRKRFKSNLENQLLHTDPGDDEAVWLRERIAYNERMILEYPSNFRVTTPGITFSDRFTVALEDMTLHLYAFPFAHSESDILIHIPELGVVFAGDFLGGIWLSPGREYAVEGWLNCLDEVLREKESIQVVIGGHALDTKPDDLFEDHITIQDIWGKIAEKTSAVSVGKNLLKSSDMPSTLARLEHLNMNPDSVYFLANQFFDWMVEMMRANRAEDVALLYSWMSDKFTNWLHTQAWLFDTIDGYIQILMEMKVVRPTISLCLSNMQVYSDRIRAYHSLAQAYEVGARPDSARAVLKRALDRKPDDKTLRQALKELQNKQE